MVTTERYPTLGAVSLLWRPIITTSSGLEERQKLSVTQKMHFRVKWSEPELQLVSPLQVRHSNSCMQLQPPSLITEEEICEVLATCKPGKSCGPDGVSYELLQLVMQTECRAHVVELLNSVLFQPRPSPTIGSILGSLCAPRSPILTF